jgi:hypothetical protein
MKHPAQDGAHLLDLRIAHLRVEREGDSACCEVLGDGQGGVTASEAPELVDCKRKHAGLDPALGEGLLHGIAIEPLR